ncbi:MAG: DUF6265 family protein [Pseudomonadota bacterium]|nr:DUF6265 family protein [Pseudomonadota bacterium]
MLGALIAAALAAEATVADLGWLSGRWESVAGHRWTEEQWSEPRGGAMFGFSRTGEGEALRQFEYMRLAPGEGGVPTYFASPGGHAAVPFRLVRSDAMSATFENPANDFPQRIHYRRDGETMVATISALDGSNAVSWTFRRRP